MTLRSHQNPNKTSSLGKELNTKKTSIQSFINVGKEQKYLIFLKKSWSVFCSREWKTKKWTLDQIFLARLQLSVWCDGLALLMCTRSTTVFGHTCRPACVCSAGTLKICKSALKARRCRMVTKQLKFYQYVLRYTNGFSRASGACLAARTFFTQLQVRRQ